MLNCRKHVDSRLACLGGGVPVHAVSSLGVYPIGLSPRVRFPEHEPLREGELTIGRASASDVKLVGFGLSRRHALLRRAGDAVELVDLGSKAGTFVGERQLEADQPLAIQPGTQFRLGQLELSIELGAGEDSDDVDEAAPASGVALLLETIADAALADLERHANVVLARSTDPADALEAARSGAVHAIMTRGKGRVTAELIEHCPDLRAIARCGVGLDNVDVDAASRHGVPVLNLPGVNAQTIAEHTVMLMLAVA